MSEHEDFIASILLDHSTHHLRKDGIVEMTCTDKLYGLKELMEMNEAHKILSKGSKVPLLILLDEFSNVDKEGREFMATEESTRYSLAEAFVLRTMAQRMLANFYIRINKPNVPTRFFSEKQTAEEWLLSFAKNSAADGSPQSGN